MGVCKYGAANWQSFAQETAPIWKSPNIGTRSLYTLLLLLHSTIALKKEPQGIRLVTSPSYITYISCVRQMSSAEATRPGLNTTLYLRQAAIGTALGASASVAGELP